MRYFEFNSDYWALIKAETPEQAIEKYIEIVADDYNGTLSEEMQEVDRDYALVIHARVESKDGDIENVAETLKDFNSPEAGIVAITSELC
ncbi:hypothetical protein [Paenibacillus pabuli]|uniref:hypothetical protein n=1 Tax=Paenibacillus pabuli TaxID=1472 RepID=UPI001FFEA026|nr:hypothetical protein [Paenibacillus pabuli]UPK42491.1 hypothetical protein KET34_25375 [Paenibacillus pabuli]